MPVTYVERSTNGLLEITSDPVASPSMWSWMEEQFIAWVGEICNPTLDTGQIVSGSGYQDGVYNDVDLVRVATTQKGGNNMKVTVTITGGGVSDVQITQKGNGFKAGDYLFVPDLAQIGGTGSGFQIPVATGDASIGLIKGPSDRANLEAYPVAMQIGVERTESYSFGYMPRRDSSTSTIYSADIYAYLESSPNSTNGYGQYSVQENASQNNWTDANGDGYILGAIYCSDPGNEFFFFADSAYTSGWGIFKAVQDPSETWPDPAQVSPWHCCNFTNSSISCRPLMPTVYTTSYVGATRRSLDGPEDSGILFNKFPLRGRTYSTGITPDRIYTGIGTQAWGHIYQDGPDTYRRVTNRLYIKIS